MLNKLHTHLSN